MSDTTPSSITEPTTETDRKSEIPPEVGRIVTGFHFPVVKQPTGVVQYRNNAAEVVTIERIGDVRRAQVVAISKKQPPNAAALDFCRGLVASNNFSHVAADTPLGQPDDYKPKTAPVAENVKPVAFDAGTGGVAAGDTLQSAAPTVAAGEGDPEPPREDETPPEKKQSVPGVASPAASTKTTAK